MNAKNQRARKHSFRGGVDFANSHYRKLRRCAPPTGLCEKQFLTPIEQLTIGVAERCTTRKIREMDPVSFAFATISMVDICLK
jgi:hypothetical protein